MDYCYNCMNEISKGKKCTKCGFVNTEYVSSHRLKPGTMLSGRYFIGNALGEGGFGITYIGFDTRLEMKVAVKEFFPSGFVTRYVKDSSTVEVSNQKNSEFFNSGKDQFLREARMIARFSNESGIVDVRDFFEENGTAYIVMEYIEGKNLKVYMREHGIFKPDIFLQMIKPIMDALEKVHSIGLLHRDISPDNIMFTKESKLKLMDFGAAVNTDNENTERGSIILKPGYAPPEQYKRDGLQGAWTDVYALCATIYKCLTGVTPDESTVRLKNDTLKTFAEYGVNINTAVEKAIMDGLNPNVKDRIKSISELKEKIYSNYSEVELSDIEKTEVKYVDDNVETMVIQENYAGIDNNEETALLSEQEETASIEEKKDKTIDEKGEMSFAANKMDGKSSKKKKIVIITSIALAVVIGVIVSVVAISSNINSHDSMTSKDETYDTSKTNSGKLESKSKIDNDNTESKSNSSSYGSNTKSNNDNLKTNSEINNPKTSVDDNNNTEETTIEKALPTVNITSVSGDLFEVSGVSIEEDNSIETDIDTYHIVFEMNYLKEYDYHSEELVKSNGTNISCEVLGEKEFYVNQNIDSGDYIYKINVTSDAVVQDGAIIDGTDYSGEISFSLKK